MRAGAPAASGPLPAPAPRAGARRLGAVEFSRDLWRRAGRKGGVAIMLQIASSLSEGASVLLLIPVLSLVDDAGGALVVRLPSTGVVGSVAQGAALSLPVVLLGVVGLVAVAAMLNRLRSIFTADLLYSLVNDIRMDLVRAIARARWSAFSDIRGADLTHVLTGDVDRVEAAAGAVLSVVQNAILIGIYLLVSLVISPAMSVVAAAAGLLILLLLTPLRRRAHRLGASVTSDRRQQYRIVSDFVQGMKAAKVHTGEMRRVGELDETLARMRSDARRFVSFASWGTASIQVFNAAGLAVFVYLALVWAEIALAELVVLLFVFMRIAPRFLVVQGLVQQILQSLPALDAMEGVRRHFDAAREEEDTAQAHDAPALLRDMRAERIDFRYRGADGPPALRGVSFTLKAGEVTAVIGPSGAGKSTLADILLGLLEPERGRLLVDGREISGPVRRAWRRRVAFVPQDIVLSHDTILENLRLAAPDATDAEIREALTTAQARDFVAALPDGLDTLVGDRGARLSGGERQRIAIAQALLRRPRLLVLDEATSALDWRNQAATVRALEALKGETTVVTIAHRPSMIAFADRVLVLEEGRIVEEGGYADLAARPGSRLQRMLGAEDS